MTPKHGGRWQTCKAFAWFDDTGTCIANISAFALPLVIDGIAVRAAGLQSGAVRPSHRGHGLFRDVLQAALDYCDDQGFDAILLLTETPGLYRRHGFRVLAQHRFYAAAPTDGRAGPVRRLHIERDDDLALLRGLLDGRSPVSNRFAPLHQREMFLFNALLMPEVKLDLLEETDAVAAWRMSEGDEFELLDVAGKEMPSLADMLASLGVAPRRIVVHFSPDRLAWEGAAVPNDSEMVLMMRSKARFAPESPFALPPMAEF